MTDYTVLHQAALEWRRRTRAERIWSNFLNGIIGVLGFPLGLACLSSRTPSFNAALCLIFLIGLWAQGLNKVPAHFRNKGERGSFWAGARFWLSVTPAVMGYVYLGFLMFDQGILYFFAHTWPQPAIVHAIEQYVGAPKC